MEKVEQTARDNAKDIIAERDNFVSNAIVFDLDPRVLKRLIGYLLYNNSHNKNNIILADLEKKIKIQENDLKSKNEDNEKIKTSLEFIKDDLIQKEKEKIILIIALVFLIIGIIILSIILLKLNNIDVILYINNYLSKIVLIFKNYRSRLPL